MPAYVNGILQLNFISNKFLFVWEQPKKESKSTLTSILQIWKVVFVLDWNSNVFSHLKIGTLHQFWKTFSRDVVTCNIQWHIVVKLLYFVHVSLCHYWSLFRFSKEKQNEYSTTGPAFLLSISCLSFMTDHRDYKMVQR